MDYYILQTLIKHHNLKDDAIERLEKSAEKKIYVDIFNNNSHLITYLFDEDDYVTLGKLLEYYQKYFLDPYEKDSPEYFKNYEIAEDAIGVSTGECEMSEEMREVLHPYLNSDTSTEDGFELDTTEEDPSSPASAHEVDPKFNHIFSLEAVPELLGESESA